MYKNNHKILHYHAVFEPNEQGGYNVFFPSFPGCVTFGRSFEEARKKAKEILELWLEELAFEGKRIPAFKEHPIIDEVKVKKPSKAKLTYAGNNC